MKGDVVRFDSELERVQIDQMFLLKNFLHHIEAWFQVGTSNFPLVFISLILLTKLPECHFGNLNEEAKSIFVKDNIEILLKKRINNKKKTTVALEQLWPTNQVIS